MILLFTFQCLKQRSCFIKSLPGQQHCYFLNGDAPVQDGKSLQGALVSKIPFRHPAHVPALLDIIRHQAAYNTLIGSCVKKTYIKEGESDAFILPLADVDVCRCFQVSLLKILLIVPDMVFECDQKVTPYRCAVIPYCYMSHL